MPNGWKQVPIRDFAKQVSSPFPVAANVSYSSLGVKWYAQGVFARSEKLGSKIKGKTLYEVRSGQFIYNRMFATEGSFAVVRPDQEHGVVSNEFPVFDIDSVKVLPEFLYLHFQQPTVWEMVAKECVGTTKSRSRWKEERFLSYEISVPPPSEQRRIVDLIGSLDEAIEAADEVAVAAFHSLDIARDQMVWSFQERVALESLCSIKAKLVDPTLLTTRHLPHIGTERIVSGSGEIVDVVTAAEDGVTSAKFLHGIDDVIYSKIRPNLRKAAMPIRIGLCSADAYPLSPNSGVDKLFLQQLLLTSQFTEAAVAKSGRTKMPKINKTELFSITVPLVPRDDQLRLSGVFSVLGESYASSKAYAKTLRNLRTNLLTALLSGAHEIPDSYDDVLTEAM